MVLTATLLVVALQAPQDQEDPRFATTLGKSEISSLRSKLQGWFEARLDYERATRDREKRSADRKEQREKRRFLDDWEKRSAKEDLLKYVGDLKAIFADCFPYDRQSGSGEVKAIRGSSKDGVEIPDHSVVAPRRYRHTQSYRGVVLLAGLDEAKGSWDGHNSHFAATWKGSKLAEETIFMLPKLDDAMSLDPAPDLSKTADSQLELERLQAVLSAAGEVQRVYNWDRDRVLLDCGRGSSGFGLRLATYFPRRFAGVILRHPVDPGQLRLDSLTGIPVLLVASDATRQASDAIAKRLNELHAGSCTVLDAKGDYPYADLRDEIAKWAAGVERDMFRERVVIANNHPYFRGSFWLEMGTAEDPTHTAPEDRPYLEAVADRTANKITVKSKSVSTFTILLNDALVDLDKEVTVVVNGKALAYKPARSATMLFDGVFNKFDPSYLFTAQITLEVPEDAAAGNGSKNDERPR